jgi:hypothetical protein
LANFETHQIQPFPIEMVGRCFSGISIIEEFVEYLEGFD